ncbi:hypothetical protein [Paraburkholderia sp. EG304]|uniref:hypothetical protein n=1 Tax=Paraburkholderia sp. EG304 TaxID=3237015 RepID=UPI003979B9E2
MHAPVAAFDCSTIWPKLRSSVRSGALSEEEGASVAAACIGGGFGVTTNREHSRAANTQASRALILAICRP